MSKKIIFFLFLVFAKINIAFAGFFQNFNPADPPGDLIGLIIWLFTYAVIIGFFILVIILVKAGIIYLTSIGNPEKIKNAIDNIKAGFLGIGILITSVLFLTTLNPELLHPRPYLKRVPVYVLPPPPLLPIEEIDPPRVYLAAVEGIGIGDRDLRCPEKRRILKVGVGEEFSLVMKLEGNIENIERCRSLGVTSVHPIDVRFDLDKRNIHEKFFEVWQGGGEEHWLGWRKEQNTFLERYDPERVRAHRGRVFFMEWGKILFHQDHLKSDIEEIEEIMEAGNYNEMPLNQLFGPDIRGCIKRWKTRPFKFAACNNWSGKTNGFENQEALLDLEQTYGRLPYYPYVYKGRVFYYVNPERNYNVHFKPRQEQRPGYWRFSPSPESPENQLVVLHAIDRGRKRPLAFDYPGVYTFRMQCQTFDGTTIDAETLVAVFDPPEITVTTPTFTAYRNQKITVHINALNAETCEIIKPDDPWWRDIWDFFGDLIRRTDRYEKDEALKTYIFETAYVKFNRADNHKIKIECEGPGGKETKSIWIRVVDPPPSP